jgi:hypothetical protein
MDLPLQYIDPRYLSPKLEESEVTYHGKLDGYKVRPRCLNVQLYFVILVSPISS